MEKLMALQKYVRQLRPIQENKVDYVERVQSSLSELTITPHYQQKGVYNPLGNLMIKKFTINESLQGDLKMNVKARDSYKKYHRLSQDEDHTWSRKSSSGTVTPKLP